MNDYDSRYIRRIVKNPEDDEPRLDFADWLDSRKDSRGGFIRVQCALAKRSETDADYFALQDREQELLAKHGPKWRAPLYEDGPRRPGLLSTVDPSFRRGFIHGLSLWHWSDLRLHGRAIFQTVPTLQSLRFLIGRGILDDGEAVFADGLERIPQLSRLTHLTLRCGLFDESPGEKRVQQFLTRAHLGKILTLELDGCMLGAGFTRVLARTPVLSKLESLRLQGNRLRRMGTRELKNARWASSIRSLAIVDDNLRSGIHGLGIAGASMPTLNSLCLSNCELDDNSLELLAKMPWLSQIQNLDLSQNKFSAVGLKSLFASQWLHTLVSLNIEGTAVGDDGVNVLAHSPVIATLNELNLAYTNLTDRGVRILAKSDRLQNLRHLCLGEAERPGDSYVKALGKAKWLGGIVSLKLKELQLSSTSLWEFGRCSLPNLRELSLFYCCVDDDGLKRIAGSSELSRLRTLDLTSNRISCRGLKALAKSRHLKSLRRLVLDSNAEIGSSGTYALANSPVLDHVGWLGLQSTHNIGIKGFQALARSPYLEHLCKLDLEGTNHDVEFVYDELRQRFGDRC